MKNKPPEEIEKYRIKKGPLKSDESFGNNGVFLTPGPRDLTLKVVISNGFGWDHVSVSTPERTPTWDEMCFVKDLFFEDHETVIQYHPSKKHYVNLHAFCLDMWRPHGVVLPTPPKVMVGPG